MLGIFLAEWKTQSISFVVGGELWASGGPREPPCRESVGACRGRPGQLPSGRQCLRWPWHRTPPQTAATTNQLGIESLKMPFSQS